MLNSADSVATPFHGWKIVALATLAQFISVGFTSYLIGLYIEPLSTAFSATPGQLGWASSIFLLIASGLGPLLGYWVDKGRVRAVLVSGAIALSGGMILLSQASSLFYAAMILVFLIAPGAAMLGIVTAGAMLVQWFERRRGLVMGIVTAGMSLGGFAMPPIAAWLFSVFGWRIATLWMGLFIAVALLPFAWKIAVSKPADLGQYPDGEKPISPVASSDSAPTTKGFGEFFCRRDFWFISVAVGAMTFTSIMIITFLVPYARSVGLDMQFSALLLSIYSGTAFLGKFIAGGLADRFQPRRILSGDALFMALGLLPMVLFPANVTGMVISMVIVGLALGGMMPVWISIIALNFGPHAYGRVKGAMSLVLTSVAVIPGPLGGYIFDVYGSYALAFQFLIGVLLLGFASALFIPQRVIQRDAVLNTAN